MKDLDNLYWTFLKWFARRRSHNVIEDKEHKQVSPPSTDATKLRDNRLDLIVWLLQDV